MSVSCGESGWSIFYAFFGSAKLQPHFLFFSIFLFCFLVSLFFSKNNNNRFLMHFTYQNICDNQEEELKRVTDQGVPNG